MKLKIEVDLDDVVSDMFDHENDDLKHFIKLDIVKSVIDALKPVFHESIQKLVTEKIQPIIDSDINAAVSKCLDELIEKGEMKPPRSEPILIKDYVRGQFEKNSGWGNPNDKIADLAKKFGAEMKLQYNNHFAMNIVRNLSEQGLLNDDVAKALLAPPKAPPKD
jgi:polyhydroxyalkanoate synthesis regulator phasin